MVVILRIELHDLTRDDIRRMIFEHGRRIERPFSLSGDKAVIAEEDHLRPVRRFVNIRCQFLGNQQYLRQERLPERPVHGEIGKGGCLEPGCPVFVHPGREPPAVFRIAVHNCQYSSHL